MTSTYQEQKMARALEAIDKKGNIVLQKNGEDALLFMPGAVAEFCIAHGYDEQTCSWSHGSYFSSLTAASMEFSPEPVETELISSKVLIRAAGLMSDSLREKVHSELAPCTNDQFVQRYCQLDPNFADTMYNEFNIDVSDIHQEKNIDAMLSPTERTKNELRDALMGEQKSFIALLKEYGNDCADEHLDLYDSIEQVAIEEDWSDETQLIQTLDLDRNAELYRFDTLGFLDATSVKEVISEALEEFDDFCDWVVGADLEYIGASKAISDGIKQAIAKYQDAVGKSGGEWDAGSGGPERSETMQGLDEFLEQANEAAQAGESLDEMMEQKCEVAGDSEIGDELSVSNGER